MTRVKKMKKEKKLNKLFNAFGFIAGGMVGIFIGYQLGQLFKSEAYDDFSTLSFFMSLFVGCLGCIIGFVLTASSRNNRSNH